MHACMHVHNSSEKLIIIVILNVVRLLLNFSFVQDYIRSVVWVKKNTMSILMKYLRVFSRHDCDRRRMIST